MLLVCATRGVLLVAEKSHRNVFTFLCHKRYDLFLAKNLKFQSCKAKKPNGHTIGFCSTESLCAQSLAQVPCALAKTGEVRVAMGFFRCGSMKLG